MMTKSSRNIIKTLVVIDVVLILLCLVFFDTKVLWNIQIGFITSSLVMGASLMAYRRMVNARVEHDIITLDDSKDVIEKLEDPYDLYSEEIVEEEQDLVKTVKEEKKKLKENRRTLFQTLKDTKASLSIYRLGAYVFLILGFLYLNRQGLLYIPVYILALGIPPLVIVTLLLKEK